MLVILQKIDNILNDVGKVANAFDEYSRERMSKKDISTILFNYFVMIFEFAEEQSKKKGRLTMNRIRKMYCTTFLAAMFCNMMIVVIYDKLPSTRRCMKLFVNTRKCVINSRRPEENVSLKNLEFLQKQIMEAILMVKKGVDRMVSNKRGELSSEYRTELSKLLRDLPAEVDSLSYNNMKWSINKLKKVIKIDEMKLFSDGLEKQWKEVFYKAADRLNGAAESGTDVQSDNVVSRTQDRFDYLSISTRLQAVELIVTSLKAGAESWDIIQLESLSLDLEREIYMRYKRINLHYKNYIRHCSYYLCPGNNMDLRRCFMNGLVSPARLIELSPDMMRNFRIVYKRSQ